MVDPVDTSESAVRATLRKHLQARPPDDSEDLPRPAPSVSDRIWIALLLGLCAWWAWALITWIGPRAWRWLSALF